MHLFTIFQSKGLTSFFYLILTGIGSCKEWKACWWWWWQFWWGYGIRGRREGVILIIWSCILQHNLLISLNYASRTAICRIILMGNLESQALVLFMNSASEKGREICHPPSTQNSGWRGWRWWRWWRWWGRCEGSAHLHPSVKCSYSICSEHHHSIAEILNFHLPFKLCKIQ